MQATGVNGLPFNQTAEKADFLLNVYDVSKTANPLGIMGITVFLINTQQNKK